jgi:acyl-coenzyme A synthetase/AMP-(fatty) acid ligase
VTPGVTIEVIDSSGTVLPPLREGRVRLKSEYAVDRYFRNSEDSSRVFRDGWFYPGDLGTLNTDGLLVITGREEAVLNLGGDKISPETIEQILLQFNGVVEAAILGAPNEYGNSEIWAAVVGQGALDEQGLKQYCAARIPRPFTPTRVCVVESLPRNEMGKLDRSRLHDWINKAIARQS